MKFFNIKMKASAMMSLAVFAAGLFSCQTDLLDPVPKNQFSDLVVFDTPARIELQVNNLYTSVKSGQFLGGRYQIYGDIRANDFINRTTNGVTGYLVWQHTVTETSQNDVINLWDAGYNAINQINVFLQGMDDNESKFVVPTFAADFATTTANQYRAEARFLRALTYHSLLQIYARPFIDGNGSKPGLPLRLQGEKDDLNNDLARATVAETYAQIIADLDYAEQNLPLVPAAGTSATLRVTRAWRNTAIALKTRVYLTMGNYAAVVTEANKIVPATAPFTATSGVAHALQATISSVFAAPQETLESILSLPFSAQNTPGTQNQLGFYYRSSASTSTNPGGGEYELNPAGIIAANPEFPATDARRGLIYTVSGSSFLGKYPSGTPYLDKAPVMRWSEVLLNLSEALARTTAGVDARSLALLNAVRRRADATFTWAPADNAALINAIMLERRIEFLGEGLRNQDIMRLNDTFPAKGAVPAVGPASNVYAWPIPSTELQTNALMTRNE
jgi:starch-binding outer membrane protein, SusD/RagB family